MWTVPRTPGGEWIILVPYVAVNVFSAWAGIRGGRTYPGALIAVLVDLAVGTFALLIMALSLIPMHGLGFIPAVVVGAGIWLAVATERSGGVSSPMLPVRGAWGRRFLAGLAVLMLQPASPGILVPGYAVLADGAGFQGHWLGLWLVTALLYLAPVYRRIVDGVPAHVEFSSLYSQATTVAEFLAADAVKYSNTPRSFARFVVRCERALFLALLDTGLEPGDAGRRCRGLLRDLWHDPGRFSYDILTLDDLQQQINDPDGPRAPAGCERLLVDLSLQDFSEHVRTVTAEWLESGKEVYELPAGRGLPREMLVRRAHLGLSEVLTRIATSLPAKEARGRYSKPQ